jgi:hypothetical protein
VRALPLSRRAAPWIVGFAVAAGVALVIARPWGGGWGTTGGDNPTAEELARATRLRQEAFVACDAKQWTACKGKLDDAKKLDTKGERDARVVAARKAIAGAGER